MKSKSLILGLLISAPIYVQAIYTPPEPIHIKKSNGDSERIPQIQRETFYMNIESLELLSQQKDTLNESEFLNLFNEKKINKNIKETDYYEIDVQEYKNVHIYDFDAEIKKDKENLLFFVVDQFEGSHITEYYIINPDKIRYEHNTVNELMIDDLKKDGLVFNGSNIEGVYATTVSFVNDKKMITDLHFNGKYATYLDFLKEHNNVK